MDNKRPRGRPRQFSPEHALDAALHEFWQSGYGATSVDNLGVAMGLKKPSIYASFGNKEDLYSAALDRYMETYGELYQDSLNGSRCLPDDLNALFKVFLDTVANGPGCPLACTLPAETQNSPRIRDKLKTILETVDNQTVKRLEQAKKDGDLPGSADARSLAQLIVGQMFAMSIRARAGASRRELNRLAQSTIRLVCTTA